MADDKLKEVYAWLKKRLENEEDNVKMSRTKRVDVIFAGIHKIIDEAFKDKVKK